MFEKGYISKPIDNPVTFEDIEMFLKAFREWYDSVTNKGLKIYAII